ncbi:helix-turn-helix domain-containing protein [Spirillospora sp. CA-253888]
MQTTRFGTGHLPPAERFEFWLDLVFRSHAYTPADQSALGGVTIDLAAAACAHRVDRDALAQPSRRQALLASIRDFIEQRLGDPVLTPAAIADAHHISLRHLHQLFQGGVTVAAHIRRRRLERCRRDLADPLLNDRPVTVIAARWGFTDPSHFRRLFRKAHGLPPADYRYASQRGR